MRPEAEPLLKNGGIEMGKHYGELPVVHRSKSPVKYYWNSDVGWCERRRRRRNKAKYYRELEELMEVFEYDNRVIDGDEHSLQRELGPDRFLARVSLTLNITLLLVNLFASIVTGSLSIISTFVDSFMDITTGFVLGICLWLIKHTNTLKYPRGRRRLELVGVILSSIIMGVANMFLIMQSLSAIISGRVAPEVNLLVIALMLLGSLLKGIFMIVCYKRGSASSKVLAMDMRNDICTSIVAITCATIGDYYWPYADPIGAIIVCALIAISWFNNALHYVPILVGVRGEKDNLSRILKIVIEHDERIRAIDHLMVYHTGLQATVELHIVMDENLPLKITHDICQPLEKKLLKLDFVERAFVHCDYDCDGD
nr:Cation efflux protein domain containing protein [Haemonchus contortus]